MNRDLFLIIASLFTWGVGEGMFTFFNSIYLAEWGADVVLIGAIISAAAIAMAVAQVPAGYLSDRMGPRPLMWASWILGAVCAWIMALAPSMAWFASAYVIYCMTAFGVVPMNSYITNARGRFSVGRALTIASAAYNFGAVIGPIIGGQIGERYGLRTVYTVAAVIIVISSLIILLLRSQPAHPHVKGAARTVQVFRNTQVLGLLAISALVIFSTYLPQPLTTIFLQGERHVSIDQIGQLGSICSLGAAVLELVLGHLNAYLAFLIGQCFMAGYCLLLWRGNTMIGYSLAFFSIGGYRLCRTMVIALARPLVQATKVGLIYGIIEAVNSTALILAPVMAGWIYKQDPIRIYPISLGLLGVALLISAVFLPKLRPALEPTQ